MHHGDEAVRLVLDSKSIVARIADTLTQSESGVQSDGVLSRRLLVFQGILQYRGELALQEISRKKPIFANRVELSIEETVALFAIDKLTYGQLCVSNELAKQGIIIFPGVVRSIWQQMTSTTQ